MTWRAPVVFEVTAVESEMCVDVVTSAPTLAVPLTSRGYPGDTVNIPTRLASASTFRVFVSTVTFPATTRSPWKPSPEVILTPRRVTAFAAELLELLTAVVSGMFKFSEAIFFKSLLILLT